MLWHFHKIEKYLFWFLLNPRQISFPGLKYKKINSVRTIHQVYVRTCSIKKQCSSFSRNMQEKTRLTPHVKKKTIKAFALLFIHCKKAKDWLRRMKTEEWKLGKKIKKTNYKLLYHFFDQNHPRKVNLDFSELNKNENNIRLPPQKSQTTYSKTKQTKSKSLSVNTWNIKQFNKN